MHAVRVLIAPDSFGSSLTAAEAAQAIAGAWRSTAPHDEVTACPLSDGGPGFVATMHAALGGELVPVTVTSPVGVPVPAVVLLVGGTAYVESAQAVGLALVPAELRDPTRTTSRGAGELLAAALGAGVRRVVVGLGGSATNDAGAGALVGLARALGLPGPADVLDAGGGALGAVTPDDLVGLRALRDHLRGVELVVATDVDVPLLGLQGASAGFAPQKGASAEQAQDLERSLGHFAHVATAALGDAVRPDLLAGSRASSAVSRLTAAPGAGAAGGLGFGLALLGARLVPGSVLVADAVGLDDLIAGHDVVVTGEGRFDWQSLHGKVASEVAQRALAHAVPTVVVAGQVLVGRRELSAAGITAAYAVGESPEQVAAALADPARSLADRSARVARTWSR
ncbi:glycerate kinase family protein [Cellulomonas fengjieae]|uniref:glycerate kinase family protein n=1 Tax=Cellulomonas fengjieae TaxID=2819978 RepID=UPI001AAE5A07|nr:glycerate kinase [Cellulomonas fengjieae]MBO3103628.1 glycerate kinase [Cellulomonas fengjieae]